jgi:cobalamin biosynthesis Co2+ chelatase CbiK
MEGSTMTYGYYIEGVAGECKVRHVIEGCKTYAQLLRKVSKYKETFKVCELGRVEFTYSGNKPYCKDSYKVLERFNAKAYFEYWA